MGLKSWYVRRNPVVAADFFLQARQHLLHHLRRQPRIVLLQKLVNAHRSLQLSERRQRYAQACRCNSPGLQQAPAGNRPEIDLLGQARLFAMSWLFCSRSLMAAFFVMLLRHCRLRGRHWYQQGKVGLMRVMALVALEFPVELVLRVPGAVQAAVRAGNPVAVCGAVAFPAEQHRHVGRNLAAVMVDIGIQIGDIVAVEAPDIEAVVEGHAPVRAQGQMGPPGFPEVDMAFPAPLHIERAQIEQQVSVFAHRRKIKPVGGRSYYFSGG